MTLHRTLFPTFIYLWWISLCYSLFIFIFLSLNKFLLRFSMKWIFLFWENINFSLSFPPHTWWWQNVVWISCMNLTWHDKFSLCITFFFVYVPLNFFLFTRSFLGGFMWEILCYFVCCVWSEQKKQWSRIIWLMVRHYSLFTLYIFSWYITFFVLLHFCLPKRL